MKCPSCNGEGYHFTGVEHTGMQQTQVCSDCEGTGLTSSMEFVITLKKKNVTEYLQELSGEDAYTDDIGNAMIFDNVEDARDTLHDGEEFWPIKRDENGCIEGIDLTYQH